MNKKIVIGVDLGGTNLKLALISQKGTILKKISIPTSSFNSKKSLLNALTGNIIPLYQSFGLKKSDILGIGIGVPGFVDFDKGIVKFLTNLKGWNNVPLKKILEKKTGIKTFIDNDVNIITLGEYEFFKKNKNIKNFLAITLGTGVGGGVILDGKIFRGSTGSAGEVGHIPINEAGPGCNCGGSACLETYVGNNYIVSDAVRKIKKGQKTLIKKMVGGDLSKITPEIISTAFSKGDPFALSVWKDVGTKIGIGLSGVVNFLDVDVIVIGGGLSKAGEILFDNIRKTIRKRAMKIQGAHVKIFPSKLQEKAGFLGALVLVKENIKKS